MACPRCSFRGSFGHWHTCPEFAKAFAISPSDWKIEYGKDGAIIVSIKDDRPWYNNVPMQNEAISE